MANAGRFKDRSPIICPAGKKSGDYKDNVSTCLKQYIIEDGIEALKHDAKIYKEPPFTYPLPPLRDFRHKGFYTAIRPLITPPVKTRYQTLINDLKETSYASYWNKSLGKPRDEIPGLPRGMIPVETTYGDMTHPHGRVTVKDLVNPPKSHYQVLSESQVAHDLYRKSHNDYNPSEQIKRNYQSPPYIEDKRYGEKSKYDPRGIWVQCAMNWIDQEPTCVVNEIQADFLEKTRPKIGKCLTPNNNIKCVPEGHTFGTPSIREMYGVEDLLKDKECEPDLFKRDFLTWMVSLNQLRSNLRNRDSFEFSFDMLYRKFIYYDKEQTNCISLDMFYQVCSCYHISFHKENIESLLKALGIICNDRIDYKRFIELVNVNSPPIEIYKIDDIPRNSKYYVTTKQAADCDHIFIDNSRMAAAGIPSYRNDLSLPQVPPGQCKSDIEHLGDETTSYALLTPSIFTNYGLTHRDFYAPRSQEMIKRIFTEAGHKMDDETFTKLWNMGVEIDKTGSVCVDTFYSLLKKNRKPPQIKVDEQEC